MKDNLLYIEGTPYKICDICKALEISYNKVYWAIINKNKPAKEAILQMTNKLYMDMVGELRLVQPITIKPISLKLQCELLGIDYKAIHHYMSTHKGCNIQEAIQGIAKTDNLKEICNKLDIKYGQFIKFRNKRENKELNLHEQLKKFQNKLLKASEENKYKELKQKCNEQGIDYKTARNYKYIHPELDGDSIIEHYKKAEFTNKLREESLKYNINPSTTYNYSKKHPDLTVQQIVQFYMDKQSKEESLYSLCKKHGLSASTLGNYKKKHPELTNQQIVDIYIQQRKDKEDIQIKQTCEELKISVKAVYSYKQKHKDLTYKQIIERYKQIRLERKDIGS